MVYIPPVSLNWINVLSGKQGRVSGAVGVAFPVARQVVLVWFDLLAERSGKGAEPILAA